LATGLDRPTAPIAHETLATNVTDVTTAPASLQGAQLERLRTQLEVLQRAADRYLAA
jgi:hypothetical protein